MPILKKGSQGFTLTELAIVIAIIGMVLASFVGNMANQIDNTRRTDTVNELRLIKQALYGYTYETVGAFLPCPDCNDAGDCVGGTARDGIEDRILNGCIVDNNEVGNLPWSTLGLGEGDRWETRYRYWVDASYSDSSTVGANVISLATGPGAGSIRERTVDGNATQLLANNIIAVIFSHGKNNYGGASVDNDTDRAAIPVAGHDDELENTDSDTVFISRLPTYGELANVGEYDDVVIWVSEYEYKSNMLGAGILP